MQKHPLLTVKEAAELLRLDERSVRERLINGQLKGEKRSIGLREKWFVYHGAVEAALSKEGGIFGALEDVSSQVTVESEIVSAGDEETSEHRDDWLESNRERLRAVANEIVMPLMQKIDDQAALIYEQKKSLEDQERKIKLLPDLQKRAEEERKSAELKTLEVQALEKQIAAIEEEKERLLEETRQLKTTVEEMRTPWWKKIFSTPDERKAVGDKSTSD